MRIHHPHTVQQMLGGVLASCFLLALPAEAVHLEQTPEGYLARPAANESISEAWYAIKNERRRTNAPRGTLDVIELGEGTYSVHDSQGNRLLHYKASPGDPPVPPLLIRGAGQDLTQIRCRPADHISCIFDTAGLIFEDLGLLDNSTLDEPLVIAQFSDLTFRRFRMVGNHFNLEGTYAPIIAHEGGLTIEDSTLSDNHITGGASLLRFQDTSPFAGGFEISRSVIAGNTAPATVRITMGPGAQVEVEQSTLVDNTGGALFLGWYGERARISRSILNGQLADNIELDISDSFVGADPGLESDELGRRVPKINSPVVDGLPCGGHPFDLRGAPAGVHASYLAMRETACDYGAIEAQHGFCSTDGEGSVTCADGAIPTDQVAVIGCRLVEGLLDCTGGQEAEITFLDFGESLRVGESELIMQLDGNLVLYEEGYPTWATTTNVGPCFGHFAEVQADGTLAVFSDPEAEGGSDLCYSSQVPGSRVVLRQGFAGAPAQIVTHRADGSMAQVFPFNPVGSGHHLIPVGSVFLPGDSLSIPGATAFMQLDGNFVLYEIDEYGIPTPTWSTETWNGCAGSAAYFQPDGNLVVVGPGTSCFAAINPPAGGVALRLARSPMGMATLRLHSASGEVLWSAP